MGFDWSLEVSVEHAVPIEMVASVSRMCTRSLMLKTAQRHWSTGPAPHQSKRHKK